MPSRAVWLPTLFLLLCENAAFYQTSAPTIVTVRSAPEHTSSRCGTATSS